MKEIVEFRIPEQNAARFLPANVGERLSDSIRKVTVSVDDPLFDEIGRLHREFRGRNDFFFFGREARRTYTRDELLDAELFHAWPQRTFEPAGEECGTTYDESTACPECGAAATQTSELRLDLRRVPKTDFAETIAGERVVSQRFAELLIDAGLTGFTLKEVMHKARYEDDPMDLSEVPSGRELLRNAERAGAPHPSWRFWVWANRSENRPLLDRVRNESVIQKGNESRRRGFESLPAFYQLVVTSPSLELSPLTRAGSDPFDFESSGRCSRGHVVGLNLLSEVTVTEAGTRGADVMETRQMIGVRRGLLRPRPIMLLSPKAWGLIGAQKIKGVAFEVARVS